jgi:uncharacterized protein YyaL (SSP411 family)
MSHDPHAPRDGTTAAPQTGPRPSNRLARQTSPYLLQHAHNPVDWWPWCAEAFEEARRRDVPVFLSVGYSTCYWCHVMERESFEDEATARLMNERFVCVKVDREERPDVDDLYMAAVQMLTGQGGWPMSVFLEPHTLKPFWGGTYFPPAPMMGRPSFRNVLANLSDAYARRRDEVIEQGEKVASAVRERLASTPGTPVWLSMDHVAGAVRTLLTILDRAQGGFGSAPKFPQCVYLELLLDARQRSGDATTRDAIDEALRLTLDAMSIGGIHDHVGGGFHRYSVDATWTVPHFEKMLYDQAQMLSVYARAARAFDDPWYARVAERIVAYIQREMTHTTGVFFTAQDAEVRGREGLNYVWTRAQLDEALGPVDGAWAAKALGAERGPNFQDPHHPSEPARSVLRLDGRPDALAPELGQSVREVVERLDSISARLLAVRDRREQPRLDDKVLASWNGLMIGALARASAELGRPDWLAMAQRAATVLLGVLRPAPGRLYRCAKPDAQGGVDVRLDALLDDYAALAHAMIELHGAHARAGSTPTDQHGQPLAHDHWLRRGEELLREGDALFGDAQPDAQAGAQPGAIGDGTARASARGYSDTRAGALDLFARARGTYDGAMPSAASVVLNTLIALHTLDPRGGAGAWALDRAFSAACAVASAVDESPIAACNSTRALLGLLAIDREGFESFQRACGASEPGLDGGAAAGDASSAGDDLSGEGALSSARAVAVLASSEEIGVGAETPGVLRLRLVIDEGYHINAHDAGEKSGGVVVPLRVDLRDAPGLRAFADYPQGSAMTGARHLVHHGVIEFDVVVERIPAGEPGATTPDSAAGAPRLVVSFQACTDTTCLAPARVALDVEIVALGG